MKALISSLLIIFIGSTAFAQSLSQKNGWKIVDIHPLKMTKHSSVEQAALLWLNVQSIGSIMKFSHDSVWVNNEYKGVYTKSGNKLIIDHGKEGYSYRFNKDTLLLKVYPKNDFIIALVANH